jgi:hypothetical protein
VNSTAITVTSQPASRHRPRHVLTATNAISPAPMPFVIEYVNGISTIVRNIGSR